MQINSYLFLNASRFGIEIKILFMLHVETSFRLFTQRIIKRTISYLCGLRMGLEKEYVVTEVSASPDGSPFVLVTLKDPSDVRGPQVSPQSPMVTFTSMNDMLKNLGNVLSKQMMGSFATVIKISLDEYEKLDFKVGDRVSVEINKIQIGTL